MSNELKLCPFCGGRAVVYHQSSKYTDYDGNYVHCIECGCRTKLFVCFGETNKTHEDTKVEAIEAWNTRTNNKTIMQKRSLRYNRGEATGRNPTEDTIKNNKNAQASQSCHNGIL